MFFIFYFLVASHCMLFHVLILCHLSPLGRGRGCFGHGLGRWRRRGRGRVRVRKETYVLLIETLSYVLQGSEPPHFFVGRKIRCY